MPGVVPKQEPYMRIGSRQLRRFMRNPKFRQQLSDTQQVAIARRIVMASWSPDMRLVYDAVGEGFDTIDTLPIATGLTSARVRAAYDQLVNLGRVSGSIENEIQIPEEP